MIHLKKNHGFTLVELMIVIVIIGVLAAIAVPIYTSNVQKAKMSEADAALGTIRTQLRIYKAENGDYPTVAVAAAVEAAAWSKIKANELDGKYFDGDAYTYLSAAGVTYTITCAGGLVLDSDRSMDETGTLTGGV